MLLSLGRITGIIVAGGFQSSVVNFLTGDLRMKKLPTLPQNINGSKMVSHFGTILLCGGLGNEWKCLQLDNGTWKKHSTLNVERAWHSVVTTKIATFIFGGNYSKTSYEYLPKDSRKKIHILEISLKELFSKHKNWLGHPLSSSDWAKNWISWIIFHLEWEN